MHTDINQVETEISSIIIGCAYEVSNTLGAGFLEKVYENAMFVELREMNLNVVKQAPIKVFYKGQEVGEYFADLIVENSVIIELKSAENLSKANESQLLNYLRATEIEVGLLMNFGTTAEYRRKVFENNRKTFKDELLNP